MPTPTTIIGVQLAGGYANQYPAFTWTASDASNGNQFLSTGKEILLVRNTSGGSLTLTVVAVADTIGRAVNASIIVGAGLYRSFGPIGIVGWRNSSGYVETTGAAALEIAVLINP